jgi:hypothetical protein
VLRNEVDEGVLPALARVRAAAAEALGALLRTLDPLSPDDEIAARLVARTGMPLAKGAPAGSAAAAAAAADSAAAAVVAAAEAFAAPLPAAQPPARVPASEWQRVVRWL